MAVSQRSGSGQSRQFLQGWRGKGEKLGSQRKGKTRGGRGKVRRFFREKGESAVQEGRLEGVGGQSSAVLQMDREGSGFQRGARDPTQLGHTHSMGPGVDIDSHITTGICKTHSIYTSLDKKGPYPFMSFTTDLSD